ncbi:aspartoacylase [Kangiella sediminilitoris]|uniref:Aspartoacylase n=1 Tax=Kangiella sediminilitoris TaxID=1144748 RepID=A0A1B3BDT6_9GAMM|nr:aspartoacylase [Kangiella sediminilitoris]AOE50895.1 Aspartoacylase [Kangiella sediminilitoris]
MRKDKVGHVTLVGGTHGNEFTGIYLLDKYRKIQGGVGEYNFDLDLYDANLRAFEANRRYIDNDLNRSFRLADLNDEELDGYENRRAKEINQALGPKGNSRTDMIIDLHTSTAPMGVNLVLTQTDTFHLMLVDYVQQRMDNVNITLEDMKDHHFLMTVAPRHVLVEVGAVPQGQLRQDVFDQTDMAVRLILDFIEQYNRHELPQPSESIDIFRYFDFTFLPVDESGEIAGMVHKNIQDRDFTLLRNGELIFKMLNGDDVAYEGEDCYISFVNEAAYYDQKKAFAMSRKERFHIG